MFLSFFVFQYCLRGGAPGKCRSADTHRQLQVNKFQDLRYSMGTTGDRRVLWQKVAKNGGMEHSQCNDDIW